MSWPTCRSSSTHRISSRSTPGIGREGRALAGRIDGEAGVVGRQIDLADEGVGRLDRRDPGEPQLLGQSVLQRLERPLGATTGLRRIRPDVLDPELLKGPPDLGRTEAVDLAGLGRAKIVAAPVRIEAHRQAVLRENLLERPEGRGRALLLDEKRRIDRPRSRHPWSQSDRARPGPRAIHAVSHPDAASCPAAAAVRASSDAPPCAAPWEQRTPIAGAA